MLNNYLKITLRHLFKNRIFSSINLFGLTLGFLSVTLICLYVEDELSFDMFHPDADRTYRVLQHEKKEDGTTRDVAPVAARIGPESIAQFPEVADASHLFALGRITMGNDPANRNYERLISTHSNFLTFFNFPLIEGDPVTALQQPDGVVLSEKTARKYFGNGPVLGKRLWSSLYRKNQPVEFTVTGVMKDFPKKSHIQLDIIFADATWKTQFAWYERFMSSDWTSNTSVTYIKLKQGIDKNAFEAKLTEMVRKNYPANQEFKSTFSLQSMKDVHLYSDNIQGNEINANGIKPLYLYLFASIAVMILLIACLNYMNLSTAVTYQRTREIGLRKTLGALKSQLIAQFSGEALLLSILSLMLAMVILQSVLPIINQFIGKELSLDALPLSWLALLAISMLLAGVLSSLYPAFIISRILPSEALKKEIKIGNRSLPLRKILVAGQFAISIMMIASTLLVYKQLNYIKNKDLGFTPENLLVIDINSDPLRRNFENVKSEFASLSEVQKISTSTRVPGEWKSYPVATVKTKEKPVGDEMIFVGIDQDFLSTYHINLLEGRNFISGPSDSTKIILTQLAVKQLGLKNPLGQTIEIPSVRWGGSIEPLERTFKAEIIGVVDNFHFESFRQQMMPVIFAFPNTPIQRIDYYTLSVKTNNWSETIEKLKKINTKIDPNNPLEYTFLDNRFEEFYKGDEMRGQIFLAFSLVIVAIACLGLFALVSYSMESRIKEIGIRKVLGATSQNLVVMVSKEFLILVLLGSVVAVPAAWYLMRGWLQDFAYRINVGVEVFFQALFIALIIAFVTISFRALKAAWANPVNSLRSE